MGLCLPSRFGHLTDLRRHHRVSEPGIDMIQTDMVRSKYE